MLCGRQHSAPEPLLDVSHHDTYTTPTAAAERVPAVLGDLRRKIRLPSSRQTSIGCLRSAVNPVHHLAASDSQVLWLDSAEQSALATRTIREQLVIMKFYRVPLRCLQRPTQRGQM